MRMFGGEVILTDGAVEDCMAAYAAHAEETGALSVHPYDTFPTLAGQGTVAREIEAQMDRIDTILVSTGGGGLIGGVASWFRDRVRVVSVETEGTNTLERSLREGPEISVQATGIAASSLGGPRLGVMSYEVAKAHVDQAIVLPDAAVDRRRATPVGGNPPDRRAGQRRGARRADLGRLCAGQGRADLACSFFCAAATRNPTGSPPDAGRAPRCTWRCVGCPCRRAGRRVSRQVDDALAPAGADRAVPGIHRLLPGVPHPRRTRRPNPGAAALQRELDMAVFSTILRQQETGAEVPYF